ncbi:hypothetical protein Purlil1_12556 [Purpureocillium lilacinum]|uniref:Uncharacterized protein n=1 Tax=Purpureocillium lilacinum TaxID=33203 RepID=A0ABR0BGJ3_PURLI|nr:hypothetical protein Purlil1_12556 [Purpureocillium lilacinum]
MGFEDYKHEIEVHGNAVQVGSDVKVTHRSDRAVIEANTPYIHNLYFPIPTPVIVDGQRLNAGKVYISFKTYGASQILDTQVYDGRNSIFQGNLVNLASAVDTGVSYDFYRFKDGEKVPDKVPVNWGLNVVLQIDNRSAVPSIDGLKLVNGAAYTAVEVILKKSYPRYKASSDTIIHFGALAGLILASETTEDLRFVGLPSGTILLTPMSIVIPYQRKRSWQQNDVNRKELPCAATFACTGYKVQGGTLERVALELRGTRTLSVGGQTVASQCDPNSLYVELSRCPTLGGIMLVFKVCDRDFVGNRVPEEMSEARELFRPDVKAYLPTYLSNLHAQLEGSKSPSERSRLHTKETTENQSWNGSWEPKAEWENLGGFFTGPISGVTWGPNRIDLFGRGASNGCHHKWFENSWGPSKTEWEDLDLNQKLDSPIYPSTRTSPSPLSLSIPKVEFQSALKLVREVIGEGRALTAELARSYERVRQWRERWGWSPLSSDAYDSPPPYSPPAPLTQSDSERLRASGTPSTQSSSPAPEMVLNPPVPGDIAPAAEVLFDCLNTFAKAHGFGIVRRHAFSYEGRKVRYTFQCDRFGESRPARGAGFRQRKSRKCGSSTTMSAAWDHQPVKVPKWFVCLP